MSDVFNFDHNTGSHAGSMTWLIDTIEKEQAPILKADPKLTTNEELRRRFSGVEPRWWCSVLLFTAVWLGMLRLFGAIADGLTSVPKLRMGALVLYIPVLVWASREFGARFRALNDRSKHAHETTWAMTSGWLLIGLVTVVSDPLKKIVADFPRYDTLTAAALFSWVALYNAALKLPWDRSTDIRKHAHASWQASVTSGVDRLIVRPAKLLLADTDQTLLRRHHEQLLDWDACYPGWRPAWQSKYSLDRGGN